MTAQISDQITFGEKTYQITATSVPIDVHPEQYGMHPEMISTACYRGFYTKYVVQNDMLFLDEFTLRSANRVYLDINGIFPEPEARRYKIAEMTGRTFAGPYTYKGLHLMIPYSGSIVIGADFVDQYYFHGGFQRAWKYKEVIEMVFKHGKLVRCIDHSEEAAAIRNQVEERVKTSKESFAPWEFAFYEIEDRPWWIG